ncbi:hypothetical protein CKO12_12070 [Chromatium okenii]|uniref:dynamin family protein n=1 Tax=Chromatium okenii TaxID=61644 RepID=UPI001902EFED|nr:dynamin family protein [Chromatium okenii]MBK1642599.1 hypothetical protein [Chromatium okenii]
MLNSDSSAFLAALTAQIPAQWQDAVADLAANTLLSEQPLRLILVGAFTVGKSSLLNMLFGEHLLQTALEETTALPTFIEYGATPTLQLLNHDGSAAALTAAEFAHVTTHAPAGAACAVATLPHDWLRGIAVIDLPGLGGMSASHRDYTLAQIQAADAILYLIAPRGPDAADIVNLNHIRQYGKRVKLVATRWDEVEEAVARGEKLPSLAQWASQIEAATGLKARIAPVHKHGLGREELLDFIARARDERSAIRRRRFGAELRPLLENALGQNAEAQRACAAQSEVASRAVQAELMEHKQALTALKAELYDRAHQDRAQLEQQATALAALQRPGLETALRHYADAVQTEANWDEFAGLGAAQLRGALAEIANQFSALSSDYGQLQLPDAQIAACNLRLPAVETVEAQDFLDVARLNQLQAALAARQAEIAAQEATLAQLPAVDFHAPQTALRAVVQEQQQLAAQPLPKIIQQVEGGGATLGRMLGEVCDIGLLFVNPAKIGLKVASLLGKSAKVAKTVTTTVKVAQAVQTGKQIQGVPSQAMNKLAALDLLSLSYWGERIGAALGGGSREEEIIDPQAQAQQQQALAELEQRARAIRAELARCEDIAHEHELTGWALEQNRKEQTALQADVLALTQRAELQRREFEQEQQVARVRLLQQQIERAVQEWLKSFDQQANSMNTLLRARVKDYWEAQVQDLVNTRLQDTQTLMAQLAAAPAEKAAALALLTAEAARIEAALALLAA